MAPVAEEVYLPPLEKCLKDQNLLLSWRDVYTAIHADTQSPPPGIRAFLADSEAVKLLKRPLNPFLPPSSGTKSQFDHRTAAINITPDESAPYNLTQIKEDALWLATEAKVDEVVALRVAVLEWQKRPALTLLARDLDAERTVEGETGAGAGDVLGESMFGRRKEGDSAAEKTNEQQEQRQRRARVLLLHQEEKAYVLATSRLIFALNKDPDTRSREDAKFLLDIAGELKSALLPQDSGSVFVQQAVVALKEALQKADALGELLASLETEQLQTTSLNDLVLLQFISNLELITLASNSSNTLLSQEAVAAFFTFMLESSYFGPIIASAAGTSPTLATILQLNISLAGLAVLKLEKTIEFLNPDYNDRSILTAQESRGYYICSRQCVKDLQNAFTMFAENDCVSAGLAMLAWVAICSSLTTFARQSGALQDEVDEDDTPSALVQADHWRTIALVDAYAEIAGESSSPDEAINLLAFKVTTTIGVFQQISAVLSVLDQHYASNNALRAFADKIQTLLFDLYDTSLSLVQYSEETIGALLSLLGGDRSYWTLQDRSSNDGQHNQLADHVTSQIDAGNRGYFDDMVYRYPKEMGPFHQFIRALLLNGTLSEAKVQSLLEYITHSETFMLRLPRDFAGYREDPSSTDFGADEIPYTLVRPLPFFHSTRKGYEAHLYITNGADDETIDDADMQLPVGAQGTLIVSGRPPTICFRMPNFSPLRYMLGALSTQLPSSDLVDISTSQPVPADDVADILSLLATVLLSINKSGVDSPTILDETYDHRNLLEIVAEVFEAHLSALTGTGGDESSLDVLVAGVQFFHAVALTSPARLWPILSRSRLLELDGRGGDLASLVAGIEMVRGRYDFLISCIHLFSALVDASLYSGTPSSSQQTKAVTRFGDRRNGLGETLPQRMASNILTSFTRTLLEIFVHSRLWRYVSSNNERGEISALLARSFDKLLKYVYAYDDAADSHSKPVVAVLADAADVVRNLLVGSGPMGSTVVDMLRSGLESSGGPWGAVAHDEEVTAAIDLALTGVCLTSANGASASSTLETALCAAMPILVRLFVGNSQLKPNVAGLIEQLISSSSSQQSSLLGHLSPASAKDWLVVLGTLDQPLGDVDTQRALWRMLTAVVAGSQQWFAISLLTGRIPKDRTSRREKEADKKQPARTVSLFSHALDVLSDVSLVDSRPTFNKLPPELALEVLKFVASCQNHWNWAVSSLSRHPRFLDSITSGYVRHLHRESSDSPLMVMHEAAIATVIAEILAMYLFADGEVKKVESHLQYFAKYGAGSPPYSVSLHKNLERNLVAQHRGLRLESFKHTPLFPARLGDDYVYDIGFASKVLNVRRTAKGKQLKGLEEDLRKANRDLSVCHSQMELTAAWSVLATELSKHVTLDTELAGLLLDVVRNCLEENTRVAQSGGGFAFDELRMKRVELARRLLQRLVALGPDWRDKELRAKVRGLCGVAWDTLRTAGWEFESIFAAEANDVAYYRALLRVLFLTLSPLVRPDPDARDPTSLSPTQANLLLEILVNTSIKGFKSLTSVIHEDTSLAQPADFALLTAILQALLKVPGIETLWTQIAVFVANYTLPAAGTSLFSWADREDFLLYTSDPQGKGRSVGDPIYAELAILFLLELSAIPPVAEGLAIDGILSQLSAARIMRLYSRGRGMGPFDAPTRLHSIWARGILPLVLNLLDAVGAPIAPEAVAFLNSFPNQISRVATELANRTSSSPSSTGGRISLSLASEIHSLSLIHAVIERYRLAGPSTGSLINGAEIQSLDWDVRAVREDVEDFVLGRSPISGLVVPASEREVELAALKPRIAGGIGRVTVGSRLEERVLEEFVGALRCLGGGEGS